MTHVQLSRPQWRDLPGSRLFVALWGGLLLVDAGRALGLGAALQVALLAVLVSVCSLGKDLGTAAGVAGVAWLVVNGFVVHAYGELGWSGMADLARLALLGCAAAAGTAVHR